MSISANEEVPPGADSSWNEWKCLNRFRTGTAPWQIEEIKKILLNDLKDLVEYRYLLPKYSVKKWVFSFYFTFCKRGILHVSLRRLAL